MLELKTCSDIWANSTYEYLVRLEDWYPLCWVVDKESSQLEQEIKPRSPECKARLPTITPRFADRSCFLAFTFFTSISLAGFGSVQKTCCVCVCTQHACMYTCACVGLQPSYHVPGPLDLPYCARQRMQCTRHWERYLHNLKIVLHA